LWSLAGWGGAVQSEGFRAVERGQDGN